MQIIKEKLGNLHFDHLVWQNELKYILVEIGLYEDRLLELIKFYFGKTEQEELATILQDFGNERKTVAHIKTMIGNHISTMNHKIRSNGALKSFAEGDHQSTRKKMEDLRLTHATLKERFHGFTSISHL